MESGELAIYLIPGMTADYPVYARLLPLLPGAIVVEYLSPQRRESLVDYSQRMAERFTPRSLIVGVSFGGVVAQEVSRVVQPQGCVLISTIRSPNELPPWMRLGRKVGGRRIAMFLGIAGRMACFVPRSLSSSRTLRARKLAGDAGSWHRWATSAILDWQPSPAPLTCPVLQIHGDADTTFPIHYVQPDVTIAGGRHALPVSHPSETASAIREFVESVRL